MDLIVGGGKYGCYAAKYLREKKKGFVIVDEKEGCLANQKYKLAAYASATVEGEYITLGGLPKVLQLIDSLKPEYVFPTAPVHIAADLAKTKYALTPWNEGVDCILAKLPQSVILHGARGKLILSFNRNHDCIDFCSMPQVCPSSGVKKPCTMTKLMEYAAPDSFILISHSMAPGMGALKGTELREFFDWAKTKDQFVVGTACDCHGVFSAFRKVEATE
jgi:hypothetical protein